MTDKPSYPILYTFRRCPYAMRARLAIMASQATVELREIVLRDKPDCMVKASKKATVPVLILQDGAVLEESLDIMLHMLRLQEVNSLLSPPHTSLEDMLALISQNDGPFKQHLDRYKYPNRYDDVDPIMQRDAASEFLHGLDDRLGKGGGYLYGAQQSLADLAIFPFIRQFANVDADWFAMQNWPHLIKALDHFVNSEQFLSIMTKYPQWKKGDGPTYFGAAHAV